MPSRNYNQVAAIDLENVGQLDLVLTDGYLVGVLRNLGKRTFGAEQHLLAGTSINTISTADLNQDGTNDLVLTNGAQPFKALPNGVINQTAGLNTGGVTVLLNRITARAVTGSLTASPNTTAPGQTYTITARIQPAVTTTGSTPTGIVSFALDGAPLGTASIANGIATITSPGTAPVGTHTLTAQYSGDGTYTGTQLTTSHAVTAAISTTTAVIITTPLTISFGQIVDGYAQVVAADNSTLTGTISFFDGSINICTIPVQNNVNCPASAGTGFTTGTHLVTAVYSGDSTHSGSTSTAAIVTVLPDATAATLTTSANPASTGAPITFTATLTGTFATPTGPVTFFENGGAIGTATLTPSVAANTGAAAFTTSSLTAGTHNIIAVYAATQNFSASASTAVSQVISPAATGIPTAVMVSSTANPAVTGQSIALTATVVPVTPLAAGAPALSAQSPSWTATLPWALRRLTPTVSPPSRSPRSPSVITSSPPATVAAPQPPQACRLSSTRT